MTLLTGDLSFAWTGDYDALKAFVVDDLKLNGNWEQPAVAIRKSLSLITAQSCGEKTKDSCKSREKRWVV